MSPRVVPPAFDLRSFNCPRCDAHAYQRWYWLYAEPVREGGVLYLVDSEIVNRLEASGPRDGEEREEHFDLLRDLRLALANDLSPLFSHRHSSFARLAGQRWSRSGFWCARRHRREADRV